MAVKIKPLQDRVLVKPNPTEEKTKGGIYIPTKSDEKVIHATIIAVGEGKIVDGALRKPSVSKGQNVVFNQYSGTEIEHEGEKYMLLREDDILAIVE